MMNPILLSPRLAVSGQIRPEDVARIAADGFAMVVNNRPDGEEAGQPSSAELEAEARRHGIDYRYIPVVPGQPLTQEARAFAQAVEESPGPVLAFCRSGNRSASLWKMSQGS